MKNKQNIKQLLASTLPKKKPTISVIVATYNQEKFVGRCMRSLIDQTLPLSSYEIIVVNDGSTDNTLKSLEPFKNSIKLINNKKNKGLAFSVNRGILRCSQYLTTRDLASLP